MGGGGGGVVGLRGCGPPLSFSLAAKSRVYALALVAPSEHPAVSPGSPLPVFAGLCSGVDDALPLPKQWQWAVAPISPTNPFGEPKDSLSRGTSLETGRTPMLNVEKGADAGGTPAYHSTFGQLQQVCGSSNNDTIATAPFSLCGVSAHSSAFWL